MANRYEQLIDSIPRGSFWDPGGSVLPLRSSPYELRFETDTPATVYGVFVNGAFTNLVTTDADGVAVVLATLQSGENEIRLLDQTSQRSFVAYATARLHATWMAAWAEQFEDVCDRHNEDIRVSYGLETAVAPFAEEIHGRIVNQPNDIEYLLDTYRNTVQELRQGYRLWGARTAGIRQAVHALTDVNPLKVPQLWQPTWILEDTLTTDSCLQEQQARIDDPAPGADLFPTLNAVIFDYVRGAFGDTITPVPGPFTQPPTPQNLTVTFNADWLTGSGDIIFRFLNVQGDELEETISSVGAVAGVPVPGVFEIQELLEVRVEPVGTAAGTPEAIIGLGQSRFVSLAGTEGIVLPTGTSAAVTLNLLANGNLRVGSAGKEVAIPNAKQYTARDDYGRIARLDSVYVGTPSAGATLSSYGEKRRLYLSVDDREVVPVELPVNGSTIDPAFIGAVNTAFARSFSYLATPAKYHIDLAAPLVDADPVITITDDVGVTIDFEADVGGFVTLAGRVPFDVSGTTAAAALDLARRINESALAILATVDTALTPLRVTVTWLNGLIETAPVNSGTPALAVISPVSSPGASGAFTTVATSHANTWGQSYSLNSGIIPAVLGLESSVRVHRRPGRADAAPTIFRPRSSAALDAGVAVGALVASTSPLGLAPGLPRGLPTIRLRLPVSAVDTAVNAPTKQLSECSPVEVLFSEDWNGGNMQVTGIDVAGNVVTEVFENPGPVVIDSGGNVADADDRTAFSPPSASTSNPLAFTSSVGTPNPPVGAIQTYIIQDPGASAAGWVQEIITPGVDGPLSVAVDTGGMALNITLERVSGVITVGTPNTAADIAALINNQLGPDRFQAEVLAAGNIDIADGPRAFATGFSNGISIALNDRGPGLPGYEFDSAVVPGLMFRTVTGPTAGNMRRIVAAGRAPRKWSARGGQGSLTRKLLLETSLGDSFYGEEWEVLGPAVVKGTTVFREITSMQNTAFGAFGVAILRVRDGVEDYGLTARIGEHEATPAGSMGIDPADPASGGPRRARLVPSLSPSFGARDINGSVILRGATAFGGANNGVHPIVEIDLDFQALLITIEPFVTHEDPQKIFVEAPTGAGLDYNPPLAPETGLSYTVTPPGELVRVIGYTSGGFGSGTVEVAYPGFTLAHTAVSPTTDITIEEPSGLAYEARGLDEGLGGYILNVDPAFAPAGPVSDVITVRSREDYPLPKDWEAFNVDAARSPGFALFGMLTTSRVRLVNDGNGDTLFQKRVPRVLDFKGFDIDIAFWAQTSSDPARNVRVDVSFDGFNFTAGTASALGRQVDSGVTDDGVGGALTQAARERIRVPWDASEVIVRLVHVGAAAGDVLIVEKCEIIAFEGTGEFMGFSTVVWAESRASFGELLYVWSPDALDAVENRALGVPAEPPYGQPAEEGHIDEITNAHGVWDRWDISEYAPSGLGGILEPVNAVGAHANTDWLLATLENLEVQTGTPSRLSWLRPIETSLIITEEIEVLAPADATVAELSNHDGLFPQVPGPRDVLYADGLVIPNTPFPGTRASAQIGTAGGINQTVTIKWAAPGKLPNAFFDAVVDDSIGSDRPLAAVWDGASTLTVELQVVGGALDATHNRARFVADVINALPEFTATHLPGNGSGTFTVAETVAFAGGQGNPWRWLSATEIQISNTTTDVPEDANYFAGDPPLLTNETIYDPAAAYTITYERLTRATTQIIDLEDNIVSGTDAFTNFLWLADLVIYLRAEPTPTELRQEVQLTFGGNLRAGLQEPSNLDQNNARLLRDTGITRVEVSRNQWEFVDSQTVQIAGGAFDGDAVYALDYVSIQGSFPRPVEVVFETRSATSQGAVSSERWRTVTTDQVVNQTHQFHQFRVTLTNIQDIRDVRVKAMGLKGIRLKRDLNNFPAPGLFPC